VAEASTKALPEQRVQTFKRWEASGPLGVCL